MSLGKKLAGSMVNMGVQRVTELVSSFLVTLIVVRVLERAEYGLLSIAGSYSLIFNVFNIALSSVLLRDYQKVREHMAEYMDAFYTFAVIKSVAVVLITALIGFMLHGQYEADTVVWALVAVSASTIISFFTEPAVTLLSVDFRQRLVTQANLVMVVANLALTLMTFLFPSAAYVAWKNALVAALNMAIVTWHVRRLFQLRVQIAWGSLGLIRKVLLEYSAWSHLTGIMMDIVYRADVLILGWFRAPLVVIGNYGIALQAANLTKPIPQILQYHATLGLSNAGDDRPKAEEMTFFFVKYSFLVSAAIFGGYLVLGRLFVQVLSPTDVDAIFWLGLYILGGLCLFNGFRPLVSYCFVREEIKSCFLWVILPSSLITLVLYTVFGWIWGAWGLATANVLSGLVSSVLVLLHLRLNTSFVWRFVWISPAEREVIRRLWRRA